MIGSVQIEVQAAKPNFPLHPLFAFQGSPSSLRIIGVPRSIGNWAITSVKVAVAYPDNTTVEKSAVRSGSVWVATVEGCDVAGKVSNGYEVIADGKDEDGNDVTGYVLGKGDVYVLENNTDISRLLDKITVRYIEDIPDVPTKGDLMNSNGELRLFDGIDWIVISTGGNNGVYDSQITIQKNGTSVGSFTVNASEPKTIDIPVPSNTSDLNNDIGYITASAVSSSYYNKGEIDTSLAGKRGIHDNEIHPTSVTNTPFYKVRVNYTDISEEKMTVVLEKQNSSQMVWLWQDNGQEIELTYSDGYFQLSYQNITDLNNTPHSSFFGDFEITNPDEPVTIGDSYFRFDLSTYGGTYASQEWVEADVASLIPSNISSLNNDVGYITSSAIPSNVGAFTNDVGYLTSVSWGEVQDKPDVALMSDIPSNVSELENDSGFITANALPSKVSELDNDAGYITASAIPSNVSAFNNDAGYLTTSSSAFTAKRDKSDLVYKVGFDKNNLDKVVKFVVEYVDGNNQNVTATLDKYDEFTQTWTGDNTNWRVYTFLVGMELELYFALDDGTGGAASQPAPSQGVEDTSWNFIYNSNPATWTMVMTQNIALQKDFKNLRDLKDISYPASVDSTGMYTIHKFNVNGTEVAHFTTSGSTSTWDTNDPVMNQYEISTTDGTNFTMVSNGIQIGTFTMSNLKNGVVDVTYDGNTYTVGATFKQTTFALKDYVDDQIGNVLNEQF